MEFVENIENMEYRKNQIRIADKRAIIRVNRLLICMLVTQIPVTLIIVRYAYLEPSRARVTAVNLILAQLTILGPALIYLLGFRGKEKGLIPFGRMKILSIFIIIPMTILLSPLVSMISLLSMFFTENVISQSMNELQNFSLASKLFMMAVLPGIGEELLFRGILYRAYRKKNPVKAMLVSSFLFGLFHMNLNQFLYAFVLGIVFVLVLEATGNIVVPMIMHFVFNSIGVFALHYANNSSEVEAAYTQSDSVVAIIQMLPIVVLASAGAYGLYHVVVKLYGTREHLSKTFSINRRDSREVASLEETILTPKERKWQNRIMTPCQLLFIVLCIALMMVSQFA